LTHDFVIASRKCIGAGQPVPQADHIKVKARAMTVGATGRFTDPAEYQASLPDVTAIMVITGKGAFDARLTWAKLANVHLARAEEALAREAMMALAPDMAFASFATAPGTELYWNGACVGAGDMVLHGGGERFAQRTGAASRWGFLSVAPAFLARYGGALAGRDVGMPAHGRIVRPAAADLARLRRLHARIARLVETRPRTLVDPEIGRALEHEVLHALVSCLGDAPA
jgi:hypothetical protein